MAIRNGGGNFGLLLYRGAATPCSANCSRPRIWGRWTRSMDILSPEQRSQRMSRIRGRDTGPELLIRSILHRLGYRFALYRRDLPGTPDLVFPARRSVLFVHGCFWHGHSCSIGHLPSSNVAFWKQKIGNNRHRDHLVQRQLRSLGWRVLAAWECETKHNAALIRKLTRFLGYPNRQRSRIAMKKGNDRGRK